VKQWKEFYKIVNLKEFHFNNQLNNDSRTWSNNEHSSRIDRMYFKFLDSNKLVANYEDLINFCYSDHNMVIGKIVLKDDSERIKNENLWKLNDCVLDNDIVDGKIKRLCMEIKNYYKEDSSSWYDIFITKIIKMLKSESKKIYKMKNMCIQSVFEELQEWYHSNNDDVRNKHNRIEFLENKVKTYYQEKKNGLEKRNKKAIENFCNLPTQIVLDVSDKLYKNNYIEILSINGQVTDDQEQIHNHIELHYSELFKKVETKKDVNEYTFNIKPISDDSELKQHINCEITTKELFEVVNVMNDSSPGPNGLTKSFFKKYLPYFSKYFIQMINKLDVQMPYQFKSSYIKLIPKTNDKIKQVSDYRPITISNFEYRIFAKLIANRVKLYNEELFDEQQICSIKIRRINDIIHMLRDFIRDSLIKNNPLKIVSIDQSKAFDKINHNFLFSLLTHLKLGDRIIKIIKNLYINSKAVICINGKLSGLIEIERGIKQGDPLSMWLYILCLQDLLFLIKANNFIQ
jgi:hypothetical protein